jgi:hypothetical protein
VPHGNQLTRIEAQLEQNAGAIEQRLASCADEQPITNDAVKPPRAAEGRRNDEGQRPLLRSRPLR